MELTFNLPDKDPDVGHFCLTAAESASLGGFAARVLPDSVVVATMSDWERTDAEAYVQRFQNEPHDSFESYPSLANLANFVIGRTSELESPLSPDTQVARAVAEAMHIEITMHGENTAMLDLDPAVVFGNPSDTYL